MPRRYRKRQKSTDAILTVIVLLFLGASGIGLSIGQNSSQLLAYVLILGILIGISFVFLIFYAQEKRARALRLLRLAEVDTMPPLLFERWVGEQLKVRGYHIRYTPPADYGVDILASKNGIKTAVQVKRYSQILNQKPVREAVTGKAKYNCTESMVVTNNYFTRAAKELASVNKCELIDRDKLAEWLL